MKAESLKKHLLKRPVPLPLFLYGSLLTGTPHPRLNKLMRRLLRHSRPATIKARLYDLGSYPGAVASPVKSDRVYGRLITVTRPIDMRLLDSYEEYFPTHPVDSEFLRVQTWARLQASGRPVRSWVYFYSGDITGKTRIQGGDYLEFGIQDLGFRI